MSDVFPIIYTLAEAAQKLRLNKNALARLARRTGHCSQAGRTLLFSEDDLLALWEEMRVRPDDRRVHTSPAFLSRDTRERALAFLVTRPPITVDRRLLVVLKTISNHSQPCTHLAIDRCGAASIQELLHQGLVTNCGEDPHGNVKVKISQQGQKDLNKAEAWIASPAGQRSSWRNVLT